MADKTEREFDGKQRGRLKKTRKGTADKDRNDFRIKPVMPWITENGEK